MYNKSILHMLLTLFFITLNVFFYTFITIALYKLICYDSTTALSSLLKKASFVKSNTFSSIEYVKPYFLQEYNWYCMSTYSTHTINSISYYYPCIDHLHIYIHKILISEYNILKIDNNLLFLNFFIRSSNLNWIYSVSLQKTILLNFNESGLFFFRIYNPSHYNVKLISLYTIYPSIFYLYVNKIQCFCFNVIYLYPLELIDLPVLIYISPLTESLQNIIIYYIIFLN